MENENQSPVRPKSRSFSLRAKLILGFALLSAFVSFITARGIYTNLQSEIIEQFRQQILTQSVLVFVVALGLGIFFGYVAGNALTEPIVKLTEFASSFAGGEFKERIEITTRDEIADLANTFNGMAEELQDLISGLEQRVAERTRDLENRSIELEAANTRIQRRAAQFEALAQVTRDITSIRNLQDLLPRIAVVISEKFGFYHVGIFLLDEINKYAVLIAANSAGGRRMLDRNHRLRVGEEGIVGYAASTGKPRIALDVGQDAVFFNNPDLPETHSEVALPLISKNILVGVLDVQSTETAAFSTEDIQMLSLLADQVSLAIESARLFEETRRALAESEMASRRATRETWVRLPEQINLLGFRYDVSGASPLKEPVKISASDPDKNGSKQPEKAPTVVPIAVRGEVIGNLIVKSVSGEIWNQDQVDMIRAVAERVALSVENARLFEETTARADRERLVTEITSKIRSHNDPQNMIQTAIEELRSALGASRVEVIPQPVKSSPKGEA
ncbi:MAG TPA: GAF domain-containing protein [Candidatus Angelobacter sp.]|nr:GAF domain-containing protein [Candidatus Angelobacter sp.]